MRLRDGGRWRVGAAFKDMVPFVLPRRVERQEPGPFRGPPSQRSLHAGPQLAPAVSGGRGSAPPYFLGVTFTFFSVRK